MNMNKFTKVPLVALLTLTAAFPASAVFAEGAGTESASVVAPVETTPVTTPAPIQDEPTTTAPETAPAETQPAPTETVTPPAATTDSTGGTTSTGTPTTTTGTVAVTGEMQVVQPSFETNFNSMHFLGTIGESNNKPTFKMGETDVSTPSFNVVAHENYSLLISGTDLLAANGETYSVGRLGVSVNNGAYVSLTSTPSAIDSGAGQLSQSKSIMFNLDLSTRNNSFPDNDRLLMLTEDTDFTTSITFTYTGL